MTVIWRAAPSAWQPRASREAEKWSSKTTSGPGPRSTTVVQQWVSRFERGVSQPPLGVLKTNLKVSSCINVTPTKGTACVPMPAKTEGGVHSKRRCVKTKPTLISVQAKTRRLQLVWRHKWATEAVRWCPEAGLVARWSETSSGRLHIGRAFQVAPSSLARYWSGWVRLREYWKNLGVTQAVVDVKTLASFATMFIGESVGDQDDTSGCSASLHGSFASLKWFAKRVQLTPALEALAAPEIVGCLADCSLTSSRREAPPLPLSAVTHFEVIVRDKMRHAGERLLAGFLLLLVWASLRFSDGLRAKPQSLHEASCGLRGEAWKTKTTNRGMPFGVINEGFLGGPSWCSVYFGLLQKWYHGLPRDSRGEVDFLMPSLNKQGDLGAAPISYVSACMFTREFLKEGGIASPEAYSLHSCKTTILAWALQLRLPESDRAKQGHHRGQAGRSVALYSRDDVEQMLWLQRQVQHAVLNGWRPHSAQGRGTMPPLPEPEVVLEELTESEDESVSSRIQVGPLVEYLYDQGFGGVVVWPRNLTSYNHPLEKVDPTYRFDKCCRMIISSG